ncbi:MAG TPA: contractile injection system protein, VgrG/Pvc8 family, partial [Pyrinomonadaceae bacterium]|nr:contractile injection system protein, VgrG/Pvc8 family [Pyrinomonadaceae bacterium]
MSAVYIQDNLKLQVSTPLGPNKLLLRALRGEEYISGLFQFNLEMVSEDSALDFQAIIGKSVTVTLNLADDTKHYFNGIVGRFIQEETNARLTRYHAEIHPWLWLLTKTADCRI